MMAIQESANDLLQLQDDFSVPNADPLVASFEFDERLAVAGHENGNVVAAQEESAGDLLLAGAMAVDAGDAVHASAIMSRLDDLLADIAGRRSCEATSPVDHLAYYFARGLKLRISGAATPASSPPPPAANWSSPAYRMLQELTPFVKFAHFTANQAIFEAFHGEDRVHVVDLDILQGYQWPAFLQALAARPGGPPTLRLTGVGHPPAAVRETGRHLASLAASLRVPFEFHAAAADRLERLRPAALHRRVGEALAVNAVNRLHRVPSSHLPPLLSMIRDQAPKIITLVEQEAAHNGPYFLGR